MIEINGTWIGILLGGSILLAALLWNRFFKADLKQVEDLVIAEETTTELVRAPQIQEKIRQIALIEKDEFTQFYRPLMERVTLYLTLIDCQNANQHYFELVYKALRKRRSAIFEHGSSERDQKNKALWTFALFCAISIRFVVKQCQSRQFTLQDKEISPYLIPTNSLANSDVEKFDAPSEFQPSTIQIHLIDKLLETSVIDRFERAGIYPFIINAVSGFYHERINPFYSIIEQVEAHMGGRNVDDNKVFEQNIKTVLRLIEQNTFSKNSKHSLVFEGMSYLLIDRNFLWELYRGYAVSDSKPLGKKDFEEQLTDAFHLGQSLENNTIFTFKLDDVKLDESQECLILELRNMVALPYKAVTYYRYTDRRKIKKHTLQRDIASGDVSRGYVEGQGVESPLDINKSSRSASNFPEGQPESVGLKDLFSESP